MSKGRHIITPVEINSSGNFEKFYNNYYPRFVRYAYYYVNDSLVAEDIASSSLMEYWLKRNDVPNDYDVFGYILAITKNKCLDYLKHLKVVNDWEVSVRVRVLEDESYNKIFSDEINKIIDTTMNELPEKTRKIFIMSRFHNMNRHEIAKAMNMSVKTIDYHIKKSLDLLMIRLKEYMPAILFIFLG